MSFDIEMDNKVSFEEDTFTSQGNFNPYIDNTPKMIKLVIKVGLAKNKQQANIVLLLLTIALVVVTIILIRTTIQTVPEPVPYDSLTEIQKLQLPEIIRRVHEN